jgi:hypothetical protein
VTSARLLRLLGRSVLGVIGLAVGIAGVLALREATLSTHERVPPGSQTVVVVESETGDAERGQTVLEMTQALLLTCRLEVTSDIVGELEVLSTEGDPSLGEDQEGTFRAVLQPALDETNERQFRGCVEDWTIDQLLVDVLRIERINP